jgi:3-hydroxypropanoate dehydrogenase
VSFTPTEGFSMSVRLTPSALAQLFTKARTPRGWLPTPVSEETVRELYELMKWGPTSANSCPARFVWARSVEAKMALAGLASEMNQHRIMTAPFTVIIGNDLDFPATLPKLLPPFLVEPMTRAFADADLCETSAMRNASLQGAYLMLAARALGLDCGPMSGFDSDGVDREFFAGTRVRSNFICTLGHGDPASIPPRLPRLEFEEAGCFA